MGDPKKQRRKYFTPSHPWQKERIDEEKVLSKEYGLKNKKEIWKMLSKLKNFSNQVKKLTGISSTQAEKEEQQLFKRLVNLGLLANNASLSNVLDLAAKDIMERRLQTMVFRKGFAKSISQARQFIIHGHIKIGNKKMTVPSYLVRVGEEKSIGFSPKSSLYSDDHPERKLKEKVIGR